MATLATDTPRKFVLGDFNDLPMIAADTIYEGAAVGDNGSGLARPLVAGDPFVGFCDRQADNSAGAASDIEVRIRSRGRAVLPLAGAAASNRGAKLYASDDATFTLTPTSNSYIGVITRFIGAGLVEVEFDAHNPIP